MDSIELVRRAKGGEREALNELLRRYYPRVRQVVRMRLGRALRSKTESADILQETFREAVKSFERFEVRDDASLIHWLSKIAEYKIKNQLDFFVAQVRDHRRTVPLDPGAGDSSTGGERAELAADDTAPLQHAIEVEDVEALEAAMDELREDYREVILHKVYEMASWSTIAGWMELPGPDAARMMYGRALVSLGRLVKREQGGPA